MELKTVVAVFICALLKNVLGQSPEEILVYTPAGQIKGIRSNNGEYNTFLGIPYAKINGSNPFGASTPYPKFDSVFIANDESKVCPQPQTSGNPIGNLDCLHLSISVPDSAANSPVPVMVWIYGGSFETGSSHEYGAKFLVRHDVIVVTLNYRVGPYGFMCLDVPEVPGNQGLKDQVLALRWVRDNIEAFGGDVNRITIFGQSAGGHALDFHILSDTEILFNNAIIQSGSSMSASVFTDHKKTAPIDIADKLGFKTSSINEAISFLSTADPSSVITASQALNYVYKPCTEIKFDGVESFLTSHWITADPLKVKDMPILIGNTEQELLLEYVDASAFENYSVIRERLTETFNFNDEELAEKENTIREFYFGRDIITFDQMWEAIDFDSDYNYVYPVRRSLKKYLASEASDIFIYLFAYNGGRNSKKVPQNVTIGSACHADEIGYLFDVADLVEQPAPEDKLVLDRMTTMWTNFAKYSNPTPEITSLLPVQWPPVNADSYNYMAITFQMHVKDRPFENRMTFWENFYTENQKLEKGYYEN